MPPATLLNINVPAATPTGVEITRLGKRIYRDSLALEEEGDDGRRLYRIYGDAPGYHDEDGHRPRRRRRRPDRGDPGALRPD